MATAKKPAPKTAAPKKSPTLLNRSKTNWSASKAINRPKTQRAPWNKLNG